MTVQPTPTNPTPAAEPVVPPVDGAPTVTPPVEPAAPDADKADPFTPAQQKIIDDAINKAFGKGAAKAEQAAAKPDLEQAAIKLAAAETRAAELEAKVNEMTVRTSAVEAAVAAGFRADKIESTLRLADLPTADEDGNVDAAAITAAIAAVASANPEWLRPAGTGAPLGNVDHTNPPAPTTHKSFGDAVRAEMGL